MVATDRIVGLGFCRFCKGDRSCRDASHSSGAPFGDGVGSSAWLFGFRWNLVRDSPCYGLGGAGHDRGSGGTWGNVDVGPLVGSSACLATGVTPDFASGPGGSGWNGGLWRSGWRGHRGLDDVTRECQGVAVSARNCDFCVVRFVFA